MKESLSWLSKNGIFSYLESFLSKCNILSSHPSQKDIPVVSCFCSKIFNQPIRNKLLIFLSNIMEMSGPAEQTIQQESAK